jgi:hypothetical protein
MPTHPNTTTAYRFSYVANLRLKLMSLSNLYNIPSNQNYNFDTDESKLFIVLSALLAYPP